MSLTLSELIIILIVSIVTILSMILCVSTNERHCQPKLSKNFYEINEVCPMLNNIHNDLSAIKTEVDEIKNENWPDWPEKYLYEDNKLKQFNPLWNIYPFVAFDITIKDNCDKCPILWKFLKSIPGLKIALLSRLGPGTKLSSHQGWGNHSNHVIRCHFGFKVPRGCYVSVRESTDKDEEIKLHKENDWILFDDSRHHYAHNPTNEERIVLIIDIERPISIEIGSSNIGDTKELLQIVEYYKTK